MVTFSAADALINARTSIVWDILTDTSNITVWESGIAALDGHLRDGGTIRIRPANQHRRRLRMRVQQGPGQVMRWRSGIPLGLLRHTFTVVLTPKTGQTNFSITHELSGPLAAFACKRLPASSDFLQGFVDAVRTRAELLDRHS